MSGFVELPSCRTPAPECGACRGETFHDGGDVICDGCGLSYGDGFDGTTAVYLDTGTPPCGAPCSNAWHSSRAIGPYGCTPCQLPAGHESSHWTACRPSPKETS